MMSKRKNHSMKDGMGHNMSVMSKAHGSLIEACIHHGVPT